MKRHWLGEIARVYAFCPWEAQIQSMAPQGSPSNTLGVGPEHSQLRHKNQKTREREQEAVIAGK